MLKGGKMFKNLKWYDYILIVLIVGLIVTRVYFEMELIDYMAEIIGKVQSRHTVESIWQTGKNMLAVSALSILCAIASNSISAVVATKFAACLRGQIFKKVNSFSQEEINKFSTASLITRSTNDVTQVQNTLQMALRMMIMAPTMAIFSIVKVVNSSMELTWVTAGAVVLLFALFGVIFFTAVPAFKGMQKKTDCINLVARENLTGLRVIRAYNTEKVQEEKFEEANKVEFEKFYEWLEEYGYLAGSKAKYDILKSHEDLLVPKNGEKYENCPVKNTGDFLSKSISDKVSADLEELKNELFQIKQRIDSLGGSL